MNNDDVAARIVLAIETANALEQCQTLDLRKPETMQMLANPQAVMQNMMRRMMGGGGMMGGMPGMMM